MDKVNLEKYGLSTFALKVIAVAAMITDHVAICFFRDYGMLYFIMRAIGRLSFPLFCFVLTEGFIHTRDRRRYALRLFAFALISEIPYNLFSIGKVFSFQRQNIMFALLIGFLTIWALDIIENSKIRYPDILLKFVNLKTINTILEFGAIMLGLFAAYKLAVIYSYTGIVLIILFYFSHNSNLGQLLSNAIFNMGFYGLSVQWFGVFSSIIISMYNGKPGSKKGKYFFYLFYPVHLIVLLGIRFVLKRIF